MKTSERGNPIKTVQGCTFDKTATSRPAILNFKKYGKAVKLPKGDFSYRFDADGEPLYYGDNSHIPSRTNSQWDLVKGKGRKTAIFFNRFGHPIVTLNVRHVGYYSWACILNTPIGTTFAKGSDGASVIINAAEKLGIEMPLIKVGTDDPVKLAGGIAQKFANVHHYFETN